nr:MAG TPA: hypothetical protein [Caudoviricetes sp.]
MASKYTLKIEREDGNSSSLRDKYLNIASRLEKIFLTCLEEYDWFKEIKFEVTEENKFLILNGSLSIKDRYEFEDIFDFLYNNPYNIPEKHVKHLTNLLHHFDNCHILDQDNYGLTKDVDIRFFYNEIWDGVKSLRSDYITYINEFYQRKFLKSTIYNEIASELRDLKITFRDNYFDIEYKQYLFIRFEDETKEIDRISSILKLINSIHKSCDYNHVLFRS